MKNLYLSCVVLLLSGIVDNSLAQSTGLRFDRLTVEDGLPDNWINAIEQDGKGYMWFATGSGLAKFDGYNFAIYLHNPLDSTSIASNAVTEVYEDTKGNLWVGTGDGLDLYDPTNDNFSHFKRIPGDSSSLSNNWITEIYEDRSGNLWVGTSVGLNKLDLPSGKFTQFKREEDNPFSISHNRVEVIREDEAGRLWIGTGQVTGPATLGGLNRFDSETEEFTRYFYAPNDPRSLLDNRVLAIHSDNAGRLWIGTDSEGLHLYDSDTDSFTRFRFDPADSTSLRIPVLEFGPHEQKASPIRDIYGEQDGSLWLALSQQGLVHFDPDAGTFEFHTHDVKDPFSLSVKSAHRIHKSNDGILWVGTVSGGINKRSSGIKHHLHDPLPPYNYVFYFPQAIHEDTSHNIWLAGAISLVRWDRTNGEFDVFSTNPGSPMRSNTIYEDREGFFWLGTDRGLDRFDARTESFTSYRHDLTDSESITAGSVRAVVEDADGQLWIGTYSGLNRFVRSTEVFEYIQLPRTAAQDSSFEIISSLHLDRNDALWVGTRRGLYVSGSTSPPYEGNGKNQNPDFTFFWPSDHTVRVIYEDQKARFWIGTDEGLHLVDRNSAESKLYHAQDGMISSRIRAILEDDTGSLWISTDAGLMRFDPITEFVQNYSVSEGIPRDFNIGSALKSTSGEFLFGAWNSVISFFPDELKPNLIAPKVNVKRLHVLDETLLADSVDLKHFENELTFEYVGLHFKNPTKNRYQYRLWNHDREWVDAGQLQSARYSALPSGNYLFEVRAANSDGIWSTQNASVSVVINPPWWHTTWAYLTYTLLLAGMLIVGYRYQRNIILRRERERSMRTEIEQARQLETMNRQLRLHEQQLENQNQKLVEIDELKNRVFANISHEFRTPLTLLLGPLEDVSRKESSAEKFAEQAPLMRRNVLRLTHLVNQLLDLSRLDAGKLPVQKAWTDIGLFVKRLVEMFSSRAAKTGIKLIFQGPDESLAGAIDRDKLEKILSNLLSNAIKFTSEGGKVAVTLTGSYRTASNTKKRDMILNHVDSITILVEDTGQGIAPDKLTNIFDRFYQVDDSITRRHEGTGIGLALTKELIDLQGGSIVVESQEGSGTRFTVQLPIDPFGNLDELTTAHPDSALQVDQPGSSSESGLTSLPDTNENDKPEILKDAIPEVPLVLIVEDSEDMRQYLTEILEKEGYRIITAHDGIDGLDLARTEKPSLIISDVMMPRLDGFALCRAIKSDEQLDHIPVVLLTARSEEVDKLDGLDSGADDYLSKPFSPVELRTRTENLIEIRRRLKSKYSSQVSLGPSNINVSSSDAKFLESLRTVVESEMSNVDFTLEQLASTVGLGLRQLHRRVKSTTGITPGAYVRMLRMGRAAQLLQQDAGTVSEVAYAVGFSDPDYFSRLFKQVYGISPSLFNKRE